MTDITGPARAVTCLIADDHEVVRDGLRAALQRVAQVRVIGEAADAAGAVAVATRRHPDLVMLDLRLGADDGIQTARQIRAALPGTKILLYTGAPERDLIRRGRDAGCSGFLLKEAPRSTVLAAVERVMAGEEYIDPSLLTAQEEDTRTALLTKREREILQLLAHGLSNAEVGQRLFISQETVKSHVRHILAKLDAGTRTHAVAIAMRDGTIV